MAYVGGLPDFAVPSIRAGLPVGGLGSLLDGAAANLGNNTDSSSDGAGGNQSGLNTAASSNVSLPNAALSSWSPSSVARHARIPASNLTTELSAKELARASKVSGAGAGRLAFSFAGAAHHDRPPEEVIDAIFHPGPASNAVLMLQSTVSRADKVQRDSGGRAGAKTPSSKQGRSGDGSTRVSERRAAKEKERDAEDLRAMAGAPKPEHYDAISPAQSPVHSTEAQGYRGIPTALASPAETVTQGSHYGADETMANRLTTIISADEVSSAPATKSAGPKEPQHAAKSDSKDSAVMSQGSGSSLSSVRPILSSDPRSRKGSRAAAAGGATGLQKRNSTSTTSSEYTDGQSKRGPSRPHSVHWDANSFTEPNAKGSGSTDSDVRESHRRSPVFPQTPAVVKDREVTASPRSISPSRERDRQSSGSTTAQSQSNKGAIKKGDDVFTTDRASDAGIVGVTKLLSNQEAQGETMEQTLSAAQGVSREDMAGSEKKAGEALESHEGAPGWDKPSSAKLPQQKPRARVLRGAVGISPDEAAQKGYHGAGWGNLQATCIPGGALLKPACASCSPAFSSSDRHSSGQWIWSSPEGSPQYSRIARDFALGQTPAQARGAATEVGAGDDQGSGGRRASAMQSGNEPASVEQVMDAAVHSDLESANDLTPKAARQAVHV
ncbi:hypothetical protein CBOM_01986 [Ceraceosorus bombacis]|uniref:Uncharacterized protein n=1 Tax=Ceraceosorus bombacis TaxID=401625 RepID=A0A0P1BDI4_9BASI|nr:hypothetical protein CBOM_01986 [Ceraceosorus bombacis]